MRYLALGDSYTIGEGVEDPLRWPNQLVGLLNERGRKIQPAVIIAQTGWTVQELSERVEDSSTGEYDLVSLLIGVNDQYRGYPIEDYRDRYWQMLEKAMRFGVSEAAVVFAVSIPDYGQTPFAVEKGLDSLRIAEQLDEYNAIAADVAHQLGALWIDITALSRLQSGQSAMLAQDGLHPSGEQYRLWAETIAQAVDQALPSAPPNS